MIKFNGQLTFLNDNGTNGAVLKWFTESLTIGSDEGCDCCINCNSISPNHCILRLDNEKHAFLTHIGSDKYKTYLEGKEVKSSSILNHNCVFTLGTRSFRFQYPTMSIWHSDNLKVGKSPVVSHKKLQRPPVVSTPKNPTYSVLCHETNSPTISPITISNTKISTIIPVKRLNVRPFITPIQNKMIDKNKRKSKINLSLMKSDELRRHVSFGPNLSPEQFDKELPPIQPLKKGATPMKSLVDVESSEDENESPAHKDKSLRRNYSVISREASLGKSPTDKTYSSPSESDDINDSFTDKVLAKNRLSTSDSSINLPKRTSSSIKKTIDLYEYSVENENTISKNLTKSGKSISKSHILENLNDDVIDQSSQCDKDFSRNETMDLGNIKQLESEQINKMSKMVIKNNTDNNNEMSSNLSAFKKLIRLSRISNTNLPMELLNPVSKINKVEFKRGRKLKKKALKSDNDTKKDIIKDRQSICMEGITELFDINEEELNNSLSKSRKSRGNSLNKQITSNGKISRSSSKSSERNSRITRTSKKLKGEIFDGINRKSLNSNESNNDQNSNKRKSRLSRKSKHVGSSSDLKEISHGDSSNKVLFSESHNEIEPMSAGDNQESEIECEGQILRNSIASRKSRKSIIHSNNNSVKELKKSIKKSSIRKSNISRHSSKISQNSSEIDSESNELVTTGRKSNKISKKIKNNRKSNNTLSEEIDDNEVSAPNRKSRLSRKSWNIGSLFNDSKRSIINSTLEKEKLNTFESNTETCLNVSPEKSSLEDSTNNPLQKINIDYEDSPSKERNNSTSTNVQYEISDDNNFSQLNVNKMSLRKSNAPKNYVEIRKSKKYDFQHSISFLNKKLRKSTPVNDKIINKSFEINKDEDTQTSINEPNLSGVEQNNIEITTSSRKSNINRKSKSSIKISDINLSNKFETNNLSVNEELNKSENDTFILHSRKSRKSSVERKLSKIELEKVRATKSLSNGNSRRQPNSRKISLNDVQFQPQTSLLITSDTIELNKSKLSLNDNSEKFKLRKSVSPEQFLDYEENINKISPVITNSKVTENFDERVVDKSELNVSSYSQMSIDNNSIGKLSINKEIRNSLDSEHDVNISILSQKYSIGRKSRKSDKIKQSALRKSEHNQTSRKSNNSYAIQSEAISESLQYNTDSKDTPNSLKSTVSRKSVIDEKTSISIDVAKNSDEQPMSSRKSIFNKKSSVDLMTNSSISDSTRIRISNSNHPNDSTEVDKNISVNSATEYELNENTSILNDSKQSKKIKGKNSYGISDMSSGNINVDINKSYNEKLIIEGESQENVNFVSQSKESENIKDLVKLQRNVESMITQSNAIKKPVRNKRAIDKDLHASNQPPSKRILRHIVESVSENPTENNSTSRTRLKRLLESSDIDKKSNTTLTDTHDSIVEVIPVKTRGRPKKKEIKPFIENEDVDNIDSTQLNLNSKNNLLSFDNILSKTSGEVKKNTENFGENNIDIISQETFNEINLNTINAVVKKPRGRAKKIPESVAVSNDENVDKSVLNTNDNLYQGNKLKKTRGRTKNVKDEYSSEYLENFPAIQKITRGKAKKLVHIEYNQNEDSKSIDQNLTKTRGKAKAVEIRKIDSNSLPDINVSESVGILNFEDSNSPLTIRGRRKKVIIPEQENLLVNEVDNIQNIKRTRGRKIVENSNELIHENSQNEVNNIQSTKRTRGRKIVEISNNELIHENPQNEVDNIQNTKRTRGRKIVEISNELIHENSQNEVDNIQNTKRTRGRKIVEINNNELIHENPQNEVDNIPHTKRTRGRKIVEISNELIQENSQNVVEFKKPSLRNRKNNNVNDPSNSETSSVIDAEQELKARKGRKRKNEIDSINSETSVIKLVKEGSITRGRRKLQIDTINNSDKENENKENEKKSNSKKRIQSENVEEYNEIVHVVQAKVLRKSILSETNTNTENQVNEPSRMETRKRRGKK